MFNSAMKAAIEEARTLAEMDALSRQVWQAHGSGALTDDEAQGLAERLHGRRSAIRDGIRPVGIPTAAFPGVAMPAVGIPGVRVSLFRPRRRIVSPDRAASRERRNLLACSGPMPPTMLSRFTNGQRAVLRIVADEIAEKGVCGLCIDAIAARAGVCRSLAQTAIRLAEGDGLVTIEERRHQGRKNSPNLVRVISREWMAWIRRGGRSAKHRDGFKPGGSTAAAVAVEGIGSKNLDRTDSRLIKGAKTEASRTQKGLPGRHGCRQGGGS